MNPTETYHAQCEQGLIKEDPEQLIALEKLQKVYDALLLENKKREGWQGIFHQPQLIQGLYLWGGVGIGKTLLMDCFYQSLPFTQKCRLHLHQFLQRIHDELKSHQGLADPLQKIATEIAKDTLVLCFDEFVVSDITDAMLLGRLLKTLFEKHVCLVTTSNTSPDDLYKNGLQRSQFLPAIIAIKKYTDVLHIPSTTDYRLRHLKEAGVFYTPLDETAEKNMEKTFQTLAHGKKIEIAPITIHGRSIDIVKKAGDIIWFDFDVICRIPRSQHDYLTIAEQYKTVFISHIPVIPANAVDTIRLFVNLVDVFYDARIKLVLSAAEPVPELYRRGSMILEYERTHSRLLEMQSIDYFSGGED